MQGYQNEKQEMESALQSLEEKQEVLVSELEQAHSRLALLENAQTHVSDRERDLDRQREILQQSVGSETQGMSQERDVMLKISCSMVSLYFFLGIFFPSSI